MTISALIWGPLRIGNCEYRSRWNDELNEIYGNVDIVQRFKRQRLRWLGHIVRMDENTHALKVFDAVLIGGRRGTRRPPLHWLNQVEKDLATLDISNRRQTDKSTNGWRAATYSTIST